MRQMFLGWGLLLGARLVRLWLKYIVLAYSRERGWKRSKDVSSMWGGNLVLRSYPPIGIWEDMGAKSEKNAENCTFFFRSSLFCNVWMAIYEWMCVLCFSLMMIYFWGESHAGFLLDVKSYDGKHGQKEIVFSLRPRMFSRACVARAHSLAIWRFCFHNLHQSRWHFLRLGWFWASRLIIVQG